MNDKPKMSDFVYAESYAAALIRWQEERLEKAESLLKTNPALWREYQDAS